MRHVNQCGHFKGMVGIICGNYRDLILAVLLFLNTRNNS